MSPKEDETSLGSILLEMAIINDAQLRRALERQENSSLEQLLGMVLVHEGFCTKEEIDLALSAQKSLREGGRKYAMRRTMAALDFAIHKKKSNGARSGANAKAVEFTRQQSGDGFCAISAEMLAKSGGER